MDWILTTYWEGSQTSFLRLLYQQKHCLLYWKGLERAKWKKTDSPPNFYRQETGWKFYLGANKTTYREKGRMALGRLRPRGWNLTQPSGISATEWYFQAFETNFFFPVGFQNFLVPVTPFFLPVSHFWGRNVYNCWLMLVLSLYFESR